MGTVCRKKFQLNWDREGLNDSSNRTILDFGNTRSFVPVISTPITVIVFLNVSLLSILTFPSEETMYLVALKS